MIIGFVILVLVFSVWLTYKFVGRKEEKEGKVGNIIYGYVFLVVLSISSFAFVIIGTVSQKMYNYFSLPEYEAVVIDHYVYKSKSSRGRSGSYYTKEVTMYQPEVRFRDVTGQEQEILIDVSSSQPREIGSKIIIGYEPEMETAQEKSLKSFLLLMGAGFIGLVCGYFLLWGIYYALGKDTTKIRNFGSMMLGNLIIPMVMLGLLGAFLYTLYEHFMGIGETLPLWAVVMLILFSVLLLPICLAYIYHLFVPKKKINKKIFRNKAK